jgi:hypothetical protein
MVDDQVWTRSQLIFPSKTYFFEDLFEVVVTKITENSISLTSWDKDLTK